VALACVGLSLTGWSVQGGHGPDDPAANWQPSCGTMGRGEPRPIVQPSCAARSSGRGHLGWVRAVGVRAVRITARVGFGGRGCGGSRGTRCQGGRIFKPEGGSPVKDLSVLTPPLLMCAAVLFAIGAFLRHEMSRQRRDHDTDPDEDISSAQPNRVDELDSAPEDTDRQARSVDG
jgi:hypothetical protein